MALTSEKIRRLQEREAQLRAQLQQAQAEERKREQGRQRRRESLAGAVVLELVERGELPREAWLQALDKHLRSARDRQLFGLPVDPAVAAESDAADLFAVGSPARG